MNRSQALREAVRRWGKTAAVEDKGYETSERLRAEASAKLKALRDLPPLPVNTPESKVRRQEIAKLGSEACRKRHSVGDISNLGGFGMFFVCGQGDTWKEAFAEVDKLAASAKKSRTAKV